MIGNYYLKSYFYSYGLRFYPLHLPPEMGRNPPPLEKRGGAFYYFLLSNLNQLNVIFAAWNFFSGFYLTS